MRAAQLSFGRKVLLLAVGLVAVLQLGTLIPVLTAIRDDVDRSADRSVRLAGIAFDEFMRNRMAQLETTVDVLVADFPFRNAVATRDGPTIESVLANHAARAGTDTALVFDLEGNVVASSGVSAGLSFAPRAPRIVADPEEEGAVHGVTFLDGVPYQTITVPVKAPVTIAWVMLGFPVDEQLVRDIGQLTDLETSIVAFGVSGVSTYASTLGSADRESAFRSVRLGDLAVDAPSIREGGFITSLRPFLRDGDGLYVALQLPMDQVTASYERIRNVLYLLTAVALALAVAGAFWISRMVSRPVRHLAEAARRMQEGIYNEPIEIDSNDEFGDLAAGFNAMQKAIANREKDIFHIAHHDSLSGLPTRDMIVGKLSDLMAGSEQLAVLNIGLERFDGIASSLGHGVADQVIRRVAESLRGMLDEEHVIGHLSRQEFVLVLIDADAEAALELFGRIKETLRAGIELSNANISLQASAGVSLYPHHRTDAPELLRCAAIARSSAQKALAGVGVYEPEQDEKALRLVRIVGDFPAAVQSRQLRVVYQPRIDVETRAVIGAEALVRWDHPQLGELAPTEFVEAIEQAGGIAHLTRYVLSEAAARCAAWRRQGLDMPVSVNISVDDLEDEYLPYYLLELTARHELKPEDITLEVTESAIMHNIETSLSVLTCMRELGFRFAIDDFGTGQASLTQLKRIPANELKIDKSFVQNLSDRHDEAIVRAAIELAHQFGLEAVAEGVETGASFERLRALGCEYAQGFYFAKPLMPDEFAAWARRWAEDDEQNLLDLIERQA